MPMTKQLSDKIRIISLLCTFLVIWRHSINLVAFYQNYSIVPAYINYMEWMLTQITNIAVPIFFMISGFFFFQRSYYSINDYYEMVKKKTKTLLMPFVIWNIIGFCILLAAGELKWPNSFGQFVIGLLMSDYNGVLWYVRNLLLMMVLYPLYGWLFVVNKRWLYLLLIIALLIWWIPDDCSVISTQGWCFFILGGVMGINTDISSKICSKKSVALSLFVWIILCAFYQYGGFLSVKIAILLGIFGIWGVVNYIPLVTKKQLINVSAYCFFIYVMHSFVIRTMKVGLACQYPQNDEVAITAYFLLPIVTFFILLWVGRLWKRFAPKSYDVATGGR